MVCSLKTLLLIPLAIRIKCKLLLWHMKGIYDVPLEPSLTYLLTFLLFTILCQTSFCFMNIINLSLSIDRQIMPASKTYRIWYQKAKKSCLKIPKLFGQSCTILHYCQSISTSFLRVCQSRTIMVKFLDNVQFTLIRGFPGALRRRGQQRMR